MKQTLRFTKKNVMSDAICWRKNMTTIFASSRIHKQMHTSEQQCECVQVNAYTFINKFQSVFLFSCLLCAPEMIAGKFRNNKNCYNKEEHIKMNRNFSSIISNIVSKYFRVFVYFSTTNEIYYQKEKNNKNTKW